MNFEYPKKDRRKRERISFRSEFDMFYALKEIAEHKDQDISKTIRILLKKPIEDAKKEIEQYYNKASNLEIPTT